LNEEGAMRSRINAASVVAVAVLAIAALFHGSSGADATQGQAIVAGVLDQSETEATAVYNTNSGYTSCGSDAHLNFGAFQGCGTIGLIGNGRSANLVGGTGVEGYGDVYGVRGQSGDKPGATGVYGVSFTHVGVTGEGVTGVLGTSGSGVGVSGKGGDGVYGEGSENGVHAQGGTFGVFADGDDYGVYGRGHNYGVFGQAQNSTGIGVAASASTPSGRALSVQGKAEFSRSGKAVVPGTAASPRSFVVVAGLALSTKSLVLVTPQAAIAGVFVIGVVPNVADGKVRIVLNKAVTVSYPVAWFVIEKF